MQNKSVRFGITIAVIIGVTIIVGFLIKPAKYPGSPAMKGFAVLELFTSEGCSSCPAAEALIEKISGSSPDDIFVLSFHVDYWNRLGWRDEFSSAAYSKRQQEYVEHFKLDGAYTPQVIVNGKEQLVGSDAAGLKRSIEIFAGTRAKPSIELFATLAADSTVQVTYKIPVPVNVNTLVNIALLQLTAQTSVKRGENEGRTLHHIDIVRDFKTIDKSGQAGEVTLALPDGLTANHCKVIAYLQQKDTKEVTAVATSTIK